MDRIEIVFNGEPREIFMSFGLLNELTKMVGEPTDIGRVTLDPELRTQVLAALLAERKTSGKIVKPVEDVEDLDIALEDVERVLEFVSEHVLGFFLRGAQKVMGLTKKNEPHLKALASYSTGSESSASVNP